MKHELRQMERQGTGAIVNTRRSALDRQPGYQFLHRIEARRGRTEADGRS